MGFLSKLFGGDGGPTSVKPDAAAPAQTEKSPASARPPANDVREAKPDAAPASSAATPSRAAVASRPEKEGAVGGKAPAPLPAPEKAAREKAAPEKAAAEKGAPEKAALEKTAQAPKLPDANASKVKAEKLGAKRQTGASPSLDKPPPPSRPGVSPAAPPEAAAPDSAIQSSSAVKPGAAKPASGRGGLPREAAAERSAALPNAGRAAERARKPLEESIVTSAPKLPADPARAPVGAAGKAHGGPDAGAKDTKDTPKSEPRSSSSSSAMDAASIAAFRGRRDRSKSPGFYSSLTPSHSDAVSPNPLKATVLGVGPQAAAERRRSGETPGSAAADSGTTRDIVGQPASEQLGTAPEPAAPSPSDSDAAPPLPIVGLDIKEDTSPGLGNNRSRHDPAAFEPPRRELELLVEFILALTMGSTSSAWLAPTRSAVTQLRAAAGRADRIVLEKALGLLSKELEDTAPLSEERKTRLLSLFASVNMALPRPIDVAGRKNERERLILEQLLAEVSLIHPLIPQRLRDEGAASLEHLARRDLEELSLRVSNSREQADQIAGTFQAYLSSRATRGPEMVIMGKSRAVEQRLRALEASAEHFQRVSDEEDAEARRRARRQRQAEVLQLNLMLAEFGEASILREIERCSVQAKIERLGRWLEEIEAS